MSIDEKGATSVSYWHSLSRVLLTGAPMGPLSPFSHAHADCARGHFEHRGRGLRRVPEGPMTGGKGRERVQAGFTHPFVCQGGLRRDQQQQFRSQRNKVYTRTAGTPSDGETKQIQTVKCVHHMSGSVAFNSLPLSLLITPNFLL